jgi:hypothetical protein
LLARACYRLACRVHCDYGDNSRHVRAGICTARSSGVFRAMRDLLGRACCSLLLWSILTRWLHSNGLRVWAFGRAAHEWCLACDGLLVPCSGSDNISSWPIHLVGNGYQSLAMTGFLCCIPTRWHSIGSLVERSTQWCFRVLLFAESSTGWILKVVVVSPHSSY